MGGKGRGYFGHSREHGLHRKGISTKIDEHRRFDVSKFVARGYEGIKIFRGNDPFYTQGTSMGRDFTGETIAKNLGKLVHVYRRTDEQMETTNESNPYRYLVYYPDSYSTSWKAFYTKEEMEDWMDAYDITLLEQKGDKLTLQLPTDTTNWKPIRILNETTDTSQNEEIKGNIDSFINTFQRKSIRTKMYPVLIDGMGKQDYYAVFVDGEGTNLNRRFQTKQSAEDWIEETYGDE